MEKSKFTTCAACELKKRGIKATNAPSHTCGKDINFVPETTQRSGKTYCRIDINSIVYETSKATKFLLKAKKTVNGYKVKTGTELFIPHYLFFSGNETVEAKRVEKFIFVEQNFYQSIIIV